jgi:phospholipase D1/2
MASLVDIANDTAKAENCLTDDLDDARKADAGESYPSGNHPASQRPPSPNLVSKNPSDIKPEGLKHIPKPLATSRHSYYDTPSMTPAARTGPPRSLSFTYSFPAPPSFSSPSYINGDSYGITEEPQQQRAFTDNGPRYDGSDPFAYDLIPRETQFRGPFDVIPPEQKDREREAADRREKQKSPSRSSSRWDDFKSRWLPDALAGSPSQETSGADWEKEKEREGTHTNGEPSSRGISSAVASGSRSGSGSALARSHSLSTQGRGKERERRDSQTQTPGSKSPSTGWNRLRFLLPNVVASTAKEPMPSAVTPHGVNITDELTVGGLSALILRLWFERDERGRRRVPILLHRLRIRISDSLHPLHGSHSVFRIECEYANGAMRWVIYRQLRDFVSLLAHFAVSNAYNRSIEHFPEFPRTSMFS